MVEEISEAAGTARGAKLAARLAEATRHYQHDRYREALKVLRPLADEVPKAAAVRELYGLVLYQEGLWRQAVTQLEAFHSLSGSYDQHPVLADCYRALGRFDRVRDLWEELRRASPSGPLVAEGRIVAAGALADRGQLPEAIALLGRSARKAAHPADHQVRQWYVLADLYERVGDLPRARRLFQQVNAASPGAYDVAGRLRSLR